MNNFGMNYMNPLNNPSFQSSYNPNVQAQQRLINLEQQQQQMFQQPMYNNQFQQNQQQPQQIQNESFLQGRQVTEIDEVKAQIIPLDGSTSYFPSVDGKYIYTKRLNLDGTCSIVTFKSSEVDNPINKVAEIPKGNDINFVTREEFEMLKVELENYKKIFLGGLANEQQYDGNGNANDARGKNKSSKSNANDGK